MGTRCFGNRKLRQIELARQICKNRQAWPALVWAKWYLLEQIAGSRHISSISRSPSGSNIKLWFAILRNFETTEPKDQFWITCLLNHEDQLSSGIADISQQYRWSFKQTYIFVVRYLLDSHHNLRVLKYCSIFSDLPSWVPDWRVHGLSLLSATPFGLVELLNWFSRSWGTHNCILKGFLAARAERFPPFGVESLVSDMKWEAAAIGLS